MDNATTGLVDLSGSSWLDDRFSDEIQLVPWAQIYPTLARKPFRLSHSTLNLIHSCERKFQRLKLQTIQDQELVLDSRSNNVNLDYGSAFGIGIQTCIITQSLEQAVWEAMKSYNYANESETKNALGLVAGIQAFADQWDADFWEIAYYNGKPAAELSFKIIIDVETQDYYCGYIDLVLRNKITGKATVVEVKTTGMKLEDIRPLYQNSGQALGYSLLLDHIEQEAEEPPDAWDILYLVNQLKSSTILPKIQGLSFPKTAKDRLSWLLDLKIDHERLVALYAIDHWPMRGGSCLTFNRACSLLGVCDLATLEAPPALIRPEEEWDFVFTLDELIERAMT